MKTLFALAFVLAAPAAVIAAECPSNLGYDLACPQIPMSGVKSKTPLPNLGDDIAGPVYGLNQPPLNVDLGYDIYNPARDGAQAPVKSAKKPAKRTVVVRPVGVAAPAETNVSREFSTDIDAFLAQARTAAAQASAK